MENEGKFCILDPPKTIALEEDTATITLNATYNKDGGLDEYSLIVSWTDDDQRVRFFRDRESEGFSLHNNDARKTIIATRPRHWQAFDWGSMRSATALHVIGAGDCSYWLGSDATLSTSETEEFAIQFINLVKLFEGLLQNDLVDDRVIDLKSNFEWLMRNAPTLRTLLLAGAPPA